jgi:hypothetical protein
MFENFEDLNINFLESMPQTSITVKSGESQALDPVTGLMTTTYETSTSTTAFVGSVSQKQIDASNGKLTLDSKLVITTTTLTPNMVITIGSNDYRIDTLQDKSGYYVAGVNLK